MNSDRVCPYLCVKFSWSNVANEEKRVSASVISLAHSTCMLMSTIPMVLERPQPHFEAISYIYWVGYS